MQSDHAPRRRPGLPYGDVGHRAATAEHADPPAPPARVHGEALDDVVPVGDLEDVGAERVGAVARDDYRGLGFVLGARGAAAGAAAGGGGAAGAGGGGRVGVFIRRGALGVCGGGV